MSGARPAPAIAPDDLAACRRILRDGSKSFHAASLLLPPRVRAPAAAFYAFCRIADDAVDRAGDLDAALAGLRERLDRIVRGAPAADPVDRALAPTLARFAIPRAVLDALLEGFAWDARGRRYRDLSGVLDYSVRVASTVGVTMTLFMGARRRDTLARACDLGAAMQLTNIARDVGEDARAGRLYLPLDWLEAAGIEPDRFLAAPAFSPALGAVVGRLLAHADGLYARADDGVGALPADCRAAIRAARLVYSEIGARIAAAGHDSVSRRAIVPRSRKLVLLARAQAARWRGAGPALNAPPLDEAAFLIDAAAGAA